MNSIRDVFASIGHAFAGVDFEAASSFLADDEARLSRKFRVTVALPTERGGARAGQRWVVYSRVAPDAALLESHVKHTTDFDAFEVAETGEVLNLLVEPGYHRIHAVPLAAGRHGWLGTRGMLVAVPDDPEHGVLLFAGDVHTDVGLA